MARRTTKLEGPPSTARGSGVTLQATSASVGAGLASTLPGMGTLNGAGGLTFSSTVGYGQSAAEKRTPQSAKASIVSYELFATDDYADSGQRYQNQFRKTATRDGFARAMGDAPRVVDGAPHVWQMVIEHLRKSPAAPVAVTVQSELRDMGVGVEYYLPDHSPIDLGSKLEV